MKKIILAVCFAVAGIVGANAQSNAIGLHVGYGLEFSYQRELSDANRLEFNLGFPGYWFNHMQLTGLYHWTWDIPAVDGLKWYAGPGASVGIGFYGDFDILVVGNIGIEYTFGSFPLQLSLDWRPGLGVGIGGGGAWFIPGQGANYGLSGGGLGIRYKF